MAGVGETGVWRTGVWVEPLDAEGAFAVSGSGVLEFAASGASGGEFALAGEAVTVFDGAEFYTGEFVLDANGELDFTGTFVGVPGQGVFGLVGTADVSFAWVPKFDGPGGIVDPEDGPPSVFVPPQVGDAVIFNGTAGICGVDAHGRLVIMDQTGEVIGIVGPAGIELP